MIVAVAKLHQAFVRRRMIAIGGRGIEPKPLRRDLIDVAGRLPQSALQRLPIGIMESLQDDPETIIRELDGSKGLL